MNAQAQTNSQLSAQYYTKDFNVGDQHWIAHLHVTNGHFTVQAQMSGGSMWSVRTRGWGFSSEARAIAAAVRAAQRVMDKNLETIQPVIAD